MTDQNAESDSTITLRICRAPGGQWAGKLFMRGEEIGGIAGCETTSQKVEQSAYASGFCPDRIEVDAG
jgi:hypothetical protein